MAAKKKTVSKAKKEEKTETPEVKKKVVVEEVVSQEESTQADSKEVPASSEGQELSSDTETVLSERPLEEVPLEKTNKKLFRAGMIVVLIVFGITGWVFYLTNRYSEKTAEEEITLDERVTEEPTATPAPIQLEREEITLEILNGSGVAGAAGDAAEIFEALGYEDVDTGNADDTEENELYVSSDIEDLVDILLEDVEDELDISSITGELEDTTASVRIILGE